MTMLWNHLLIGLRILLLGVAVIAGMAFILANAKDALAAELKDVSIVTDNTLKLGDIFDGLTQNAGYVLGPAPQPGEDMVLNARTLYRIAVALDLSWRPANAAQQIVIRRAATVIPFDTVRQAIIDRLESEDGMEGRFDLALYSQDSDIVLPQGERADVDFQSFSFDPQGDFFEAVVVAPSRDAPLVTFPISGKVVRLIDVPVLRDTLRNGDIIGQTDIDWIEIPARKVQRDLVLKSADLIGMTPRHSALAGKPLLEGDLEHPQIVRRGDVVTLIYEDGPMRLSAKGKALQSGAMGDVIRISNLNSSKNVEGLVTNAREVTVQ